VMEEPLCTLPALSSAVVEELRVGMSSLESIEVTIAPGQLAPRGTSTLEAVFSYLGRPFFGLAQGSLETCVGMDGIARDTTRCRWSLGCRM
jgi:hypothetical protein